MTHANKALKLHKECFVTQVRLSWRYCSKTEIAPRPWAVLQYHLLQQLEQTRKFQDVRITPGTEIPCFDQH